MTGIAPKGGTLRTSTAALVATTLVGTVLLVAGCSPSGTESPAPRSVTAEEAQLLAVARFKNFDAGARAFSTEFRDSGHELSLVGWYDYATGVGYAALSDSGTPNSLLTWQGGTLAVHAPAGTDAPLPPPGVAESPDTTWRFGPIDPSASTLHAALAFVAALGANRPENPLLLQQGGAEWLRDDSVGGAPVTVFSGPSGLATAPASATAAPAEASGRVRYWVDPTGLMLRVEVLFGANWVTIELGPADGASLDWSVPGPTA